MTPRGIIVLLGLVALVSACGTLPRGAFVVTCKPIVRQGQVDWRDGGQGNHPLNTHGGQAIVWPQLILQDGYGTNLVIDFVDRSLLKILKTDQFYSFAILPPQRDEHGMTLPTVLWVKQNGKKIYAAAD